MAIINLVPPLSELVPSFIAVATESSIGGYGGYENGRLHQKASILDKIRVAGWLNDFRDIDQLGGRIQKILGMSGEESYIRYYLTLVKALLLEKVNKTNWGASEEYLKKLPYDNKTDGFDMFLPGWELPQGIVYFICQYGQFPDFSLAFIHKDDKSYLAVLPPITLPIHGRIALNKVDRIVRSNEEISLLPFVIS